MVKRSSTSSDKGAVKLKMEFVGPFALHNLQCWICEINPAVYDMYPNWIFRPCWKCQAYDIGNGKIMHHWLLKLLARFVFNHP